jgi:hypothetical protein
MGGCGSGRGAGIRRHRVESCIALDVNELHRKSVLTRDTSGTLTWEREGEALGSVQVSAEENAIALCYRDREFEAFTSVEVRIGLSWVPATFGGARPYFICPGTTCARRVALLYFARGVFRCRRCHNLAYECQREDKRRRARRRANKLRASMGAPSWRALALTHTERPKGMWRTPYNQLRRSIEAADTVANATYVHDLTKLTSRVVRRGRRRR